MKTNSNTNTNSNVTQVSTKQVECKETTAAASSSDSNASSSSNIASSSSSSSSSSFFSSLSALLLLVLSGSTKTLGTQFTSDATHHIIQQQVQNEQHVSQNQHSSSSSPSFYPSHSLTCQFAASLLLIFINYAGQFAVGVCNCNSKDNKKTQTVVTVATTTTTTKVVATLSSSSSNPLSSDSSSTSLPSYSPFFSFFFTRGRYLFLLSFLDVIGCFFCLVGSFLVGSGLYQLLYASILVMTAVLSRWLRVQGSSQSRGQWICLVWITAGLVASSLAAQRQAQQTAFASASTSSSSSSSSQAAWTTGLGIFFTLLGTFIYAFQSVLCDLMNRNPNLFSYHRRKNNQNSNEKNDDDRRGIISGSELNSEIGRWGVVMTIVCMVGLSCYDACMMYFYQSTSTLTDNASLNMTQIWIYSFVQLYWPLPLQPVLQSLSASSSLSSLSSFSLLLSSPLFRSHFSYLFVLCFYLLCNLLHRLLYWQLIASRGSLFAGLANALRTVAVYLASAYLFCTEGHQGEAASGIVKLKTNQLQCMNEEKTVAAMMVVIGVLVYQIVKTKIQDKENSNNKPKKE